MTRNYLLALICFALGLLCKPMLVTWPFVMLLLDFWPLARFQTGQVGRLPERFYLNALMENLAGRSRLFLPAPGCLAADPGAVV
jgi:hypothetical protein